MFVREFLDVDEEVDAGALGFGGGYFFGGSGSGGPVGGSFGVASGGGGVLFDFFDHLADVFVAFVRVGIEEFFLVFVNSCEVVAAGGGGDVA